VGVTVIVVVPLGVTVCGVGVQNLNGVEEVGVTLASTSLVLVAVLAVVGVDVSFAGCVAVEVSSTSA